MGSSPRHQPAHHRPIDVYQGQEDIRHPSVELGGLGPRDQVHAPVRQGWVLVDPSLSVNWSASSISMAWIGSSTNFPSIASIMQRKLVLHFFPSFSRRSTRRRIFLSVLHILLKYLVATELSLYVPWYHAYLILYFKSGLYECQISTTPVRSYVLRLSVAGQLSKNVYE